MHGMYGITGKTPCKYGPVFALYLYCIESNRVNMVQKRVCIYTAFFLCMVLCAARVSYAIMVSYLAHVKTNVETHEMIQNCGLVYFINREDSSANYF